MYHCTLSIRLLSPNPLLEEALRCARVRPGFSHDIAVADMARELLPQLKGADVVLLGPEQLMLLTEMRQGVGASAVFILVENGSGSALPDAHMLALLDDVWSGADDAALLAFRVERLLDSAKARKDSMLTSQYLDTLIDSTTDLVWFKDAHGMHLKVNEAFCRFVGKTRGEVEGKGFDQIWGLDMEEASQVSEVCQQTDAQVLGQGQPGTFDEVLKSGLGLRQFKTRKSPLFNEDGSVMGTVGIAHDVTDLANMSSELDLVLQSMPFAVTIVDMEERLVNANGKFRELFGYTEKDDLTGIPGRDVRARGTKNYGMQWLKDLSEVSFTRHGGETVLTIYNRHIVDIFNNRIGSIVIFRDVSLERRFERHLKRKANTDELTGLFNRRYFYDKVPADVAVGDALVYVDLDNFKNVNDQYGHDAGDRALVLAANTLRESFPEAVIARLGGDEFVVYLPGGATPEEVWTGTQALLDALRRLFDAETEFRGLSASAGIVVADAPDLTRDELVRRGDVAMYEAKRQGKRRACLYSQALAAAQNPKSSCRQNNRCSLRQ